jgi:hypothetical protein
MFPLFTPFSSASQGSIKPRSSRGKANHTTIRNPDQRYQPFFRRRCRGCNFAILVRLLETLLVFFTFSFKFLFTVISLLFYLYLKTQKQLVVNFFFNHRKKTQNIIIIAEKNLREYVIPNDDCIRAPINQPIVEEENYEIKPNLLSLVQQNQFGGSAAEDSGMHLKTFTEICAMMCDTSQTYL